MQLTDIDLRLLRVFVAVVQSRGITNAQTILNRDTSTISKQLKTLEDRIGIRLCDRGRSGFALTHEGNIFFRRTTDMLSSIARFEQDAKSLQGKLAGSLRLALIDNLVTDLNCPMIDTLARFGNRQDNDVTLFIDIMAPAQIECSVLEGNTDVGVAIFPSHLASLHYETLYFETDWLLCAPGHPLAGVSSIGSAQRLLSQSAKVSRSFLQAEELQSLQADKGSVSAWVSNIEAALMLILAGSHIGFLPKHYVQSWLETGDLVAVFPEHYHRQSPIEAVMRQGQDEKRPALAAFMEDLQTTLSTTFSHSTQKLA
jgi:DNA-binding transcriptional LysR family regulator